MTRTLPVATPVGGRKVEAVRRGTFQDQTVNYAAVGASGAPDLMRYPPDGSIPAEQSWRIGSGHERFTAAGEALLAWRALRDGGLVVTDLRPGSGTAYTGVSFDEDGSPMAPGRTDADQRFDADGTPFVGAGTTVRVHGRVSGMRADGELRVISVIEQARRVGFVLGTVGGSVVRGEESFMVEWRTDDEVWFTVRAFDTGVTLPYRLLPALVRRRRRALFDRYLRSMSPMYTTA